MLVPPATIYLLSYLQSKEVGNFEDVEQFGGVQSRGDRRLPEDPDSHACRGTDAGFVHLSCLAEYAAAKSEQKSDMNEFIKPWESCPGCHQSYQNMSLELILRPSLSRVCSKAVSRRYKNADGGSLLLEAVCSQNHAW